jgi:hypothetical protein
LNCTPGSDNENEHEDDGQYDYEQECAQDFFDTRVVV